MVGNVAEFEQGQNRCCQHHMTGKQRVAAAVFSHHHHEKVILHDFVLFYLPPAILFLYFVFELTICLLYHLQLHMRASVAVAAHAMLQQE